MVNNSMRVRTVRQVKQQRFKGGRRVAGNDINNAVYKPVPPQKPLTPPYRMPPQPPGSLTHYGENHILPGAAPMELQSGISNLALRTHSSKFPIEREMIISSDKSNSKIPLMHEYGTPSGVRRSSGLQLLPRPTGAIAPDHPPKQMQAWNTQSQLQPSQDIQAQSSLTGAIPRAPARLPEDVTALADRENANKDSKDSSKNAVTKTYYTLKDLISSKFKKDNLELPDELNNVSVQQQMQLASEQDEYRSPYSALPVHMRQGQNLNQSQPNIWINRQMTESPSRMLQSPYAQQQQQPQQQNQLPPNPLQRSSIQQQRATSQPQLNMPFERRGSQTLLDQVTDRRGSLANIDVTDSDEGGFASRARRPTTMYQLPHHLQPNGVQTPQHLTTPQIHSSRNSPQSFQNGSFANQQQYNMASFQHQHTPANPQYNPNLQQQYAGPSQQMGETMFQTQKVDLTKMHHENSINTTTNSLIQARQDALRSSFQKQESQQIVSSPSHSNFNPNYSEHDGVQPPKIEAKPTRNELRPDLSKQIPGSAASSDYDKSGNQSSNVDSGRGSAAYSSGRKGATIDISPENSDSLARPPNNDSEWVDIVDAELRHILEPGMQGLSIRPESTVSGSVSSMSPPLPPLSPNESNRYKGSQIKENLKQEYGTDSYNRPGRGSGPIGPSRAGWPGSSIQKQGHSRSSTKKQEQSLLKRHLFGLDNDMTSTTTRSLDLESLLGAPWGGGQSVSDSETDTQGLRHIRSQLEGLENMYSEVLRMLGSRNAPTRFNEPQLRGARRRHGSLSSLPSSSVSGRPIRDRRRTDDRRKVRDIKGINKRFQRLESHVVTLARSVAHLSSEMRSQHQVTQELERLRDDLANLRAQSGRSANLYRNGENGSYPEPPNLTNPKRVKKLTKFFGEDPPLMRLFLKNLGYEKYANLFESERVGMIELPYLGEERLQKLGVPLGPRLRILQEAQISLCKDTTLCIV